MNIPNLLTLFRILLVPIFVILLIYGQTFSACLAVLLISMDIFILIGVAVLFLNHKSFEIRPTLLGKVSTFFQLATVVIALSVAQPLLGLQPFLIGSIYLAAALTLLSGFHYTFLWVRQM